MSLAGRPSNVGTRFHNFLYAELDLDFVCKAFTTSDLAVAIAGIRALGIRGCGVSMPYKEACIELVGRGGRLGGGDRIGEHDREHRRAAARLQHRLPGRLPGPGGPRPRRARQRGHGKAVVAALRDAGFHAGTVVARNPRTGAALAERYGYPWGGRGWRQPAPAAGERDPGRDVGWACRRRPAGGAGGGGRRRDRLGCGRGAGADPAGAPGACSGKQVITGAEVIALQAVEQFVLYRGVRPGDD
jgi:shikimate dehydrogenase